MKVVIIGASDNPDRYSYKAAKALLDKGFEIVLVGLKKKSVLNHEILIDIPDNLEGNVVTLYVGPQNQEPYFNALLAASPRKVIFNPGTENEKLQSLLNENNIPWEEACTLVKLSLNQFP